MKPMVEVTIIVKKDGKFFSSNKVEDNDVVNLHSQLQFVIEVIRRELEGKIL